MSTFEQDPALQNDALTAPGAVRVLTDYGSGASIRHCRCPVGVRDTDRTATGFLLAHLTIDAVGGIANLTPPRLAAAAPSGTSPLVVLQEGSP